MGQLKHSYITIEWAGKNLTNWQGGGKLPPGDRVAFDAQITLSGENQLPTGSFKVNPTKDGTDIYEDLVLNHAKEPIVITILYPGGKSVSFTFVYNGESTNFGLNQDITVKLASQLSGKINGAIRSTAVVADDEKEGFKAATVVEKTAERYGVENDLFKVSEASSKYWDRVKLGSAYGNDRTLGNAMGSIAKTTGDQLTSLNIGKDSVVFWGPWSDENETMEIATANSPKKIEPDKRYGFALGPSVISSITKDRTFRPPQETTTNDPAKTAFAQADKDKDKPRARTAETKQQENLKDSQKETSSPLGTSNNRTNPGTLNVDNPKGPDRQNALNKEGESSLSAYMLLTPVLIGIKPMDIVYVPSLKGGIIEDYKVTSVSYSQNNGEISVSISASRPFDFLTPMNEKEAKKMQSFLQSNQMVGSNSSLESWDRYSWGP